MESGIIRTYKNNGIITPELISSPCFWVLEYLFKKLFLRQFFLNSIYFSSCKIPENQESASLMVTNKVMPYHAGYTMTLCTRDIQKIIQLGDFHGIS